MKEYDKFSDVFMNFVTETNLETHLTSGKYLELMGVISDLRHREEECINYSKYSLSFRRFWVEGKTILDEAVEFPFYFPKNVGDVLVKWFGFYSEPIYKKNLWMLAENIDQQEFDGSRNRFVTDFFIILRSLFKPEDQFALLSVLKRVALPIVPVPDLDTDE